MYVYIRITVWRPKYAHICVATSARVFTHTRTHVCACVCVFVCVRVCVCVCARVCVVCTHILIHTYVADNL